MTVGDDKDELPPAKASKSEDASAPWSRRKKIFVGAVSLCLLTAAGYGLRTHGPRWLALRDVKRHGAAFARCAFGETPRTNETAEKRLRRVFLTAVGILGQETLSTHGTAWPGRCVEHAVALSDALGRAGKPTLAAPSEIGARMLDIARGESNASALPLEMLWGFADSDGGPEEVPLPPAPATPLSLDAPNIAERIAFGDLATDPVPTQGARLLFRGDRGGMPLLCTFAKGLEEGRCEVLANKARSSYPRLWPSAGDGAKALVMDRSAARSTFFRADTGQAFGEAYEVVGGFSAPPEMVAVVETDLGKKGEELGLWLERFEGTQVVDRVKIEPRPAVPFARVQVLGEKLVWIEPRSGKAHLLMRSLGRSKGKPGEIEDAGVLPYEAMRLGACRSEKGLAVWAQAKGKAAVTMRSEVGGSPLVEVAEPVREAGVVVTSEELGCEEDATERTLVLTGKSGYEVERVRILGGAATVSRFALPNQVAVPNLVAQVPNLVAQVPNLVAQVPNLVAQIPNLVARRDPEDRAAASIDGEASVAAASLGPLVLVVWRTERAGIRARLAKPEALADAPDIVVYDEASDDVNGAGRVHAMRLIGRADAALLVLHGASGIKVIRIDAKGHFTALRAAP